MDAPEASKEHKVDITDSFIAPWGLANETRPFHLIWEGKVDAIQLGLAEPVEIIDIYNTKSELESYESPDLVEGDVKSFEIPMDELEVEGYLSAEFKIPETFDEVMVGQKIAVAFISGSETIERWEDYTFTIRPKIKPVDSPNSLTLSEVDTIDIAMKYIGFGMAEVRVEAEAQGELVSEQESIYHDILDKLTETEIHKEDSEHFEKSLEEWEENGNFEKESYDEFVDEFRSKLQKGDIFEEYDEEELRRYAEILRDDRESEQNDTLGAYKAVEYLLMNSILDMVDRHPEENIQLDNPNTKIELDTEVNNICIIYHLRDVEKNRYDSIKIPIELEDNLDAPPEFAADINTTWEHLQLDPDEEREKALDRLEEEL